MKEKGKEKGDVCVFILSFPSLWPYKGQKMEQLLYKKLHKFVGTTKKKKHVQWKESNSDPVILFNPRW